MLAAACEQLRRICSGFSGDAVELDEQLENAVCELPRDDRSLLELVIYPEEGVEGRRWCLNDPMRQDPATEAAEQAGNIVGALLYRPRLFRTSRRPPAPPIRLSARPQARPRARRARRARRRTRRSTRGPTGDEPGEGEPASAEVGA
ncbi:MAG: hypothetical protein ACLPZR_33845 [Solirubrobacteraceae bacterium]